MAVSLDLAIAKEKRFSSNQILPSWFKKAFAHQQLPAAAHGPNPAEHIQRPAAQPLTPATPQLPQATPMAQAQPAASAVAQQPAIQQPQPQMPPALKVAATRVLSKKELEESKRMQAGYVGGLAGNLGMFALNRALLKPLNMSHRLASRPQINHLSKDIVGKFTPVINSRSGASAHIDYSHGYHSVNMPNMSKSPAAKYRVNRGILAHELGHVKAHNELTKLIGHTGSAMFGASLRPLALTGSIAGTVGVVNLPEGKPALGAAIGGTALAIPQVVDELAASHYGGKHLARYHGGSRMNRIRNYSSTFTGVPSYVTAALLPLATYAGRREALRRYDASKPKSKSLVPQSLSNLMKTSAAAPQQPPPPPPGSFKPSSLLFAAADPRALDTQAIAMIHQKMVPQQPLPPQSQSIASGQQLQNNQILQKTGKLDKNLQYRFLNGFLSSLMQKQATGRVMARPMMQQRQMPPQMSQWAIANNRGNNPMQNPWMAAQQQRMMVNRAALSGLPNMQVNNGAPQMAQDGLQMGGVPITPPSGNRMAPERSQSPAMVVRQESNGQFDGPDVPSPFATPTPTPGGSGSTPPLGVDEQRQRSYDAHQSLQAFQAAENARRESEYRNVDPNTPPEVLQRTHPELARQLEQANGDNIFGQVSRGIASVGNQLGLTNQTGPMTRDEIIRQHRESGWRDTYRQPQDLSARELLDPRTPAGARFAMLRNNPETADQANRMLWHASSPEASRQFIAEHRQYLASRPSGGGGQWSEPNNGSPAQGSSQSGGDWGEPTPPAQPLPQTPTASSLPPTAPAQIPAANAVPPGSNPYGSQAATPYSTPAPAANAQAPNTPQPAQPAANAVQPGTNPYGTPAATPYQAQTPAPATTAAPPQQVAFGSAHPATASPTAPATQAPPPPIG